MCNPDTLIDNQTLGALLLGLGGAAVIVAGWIQLHSVGWPLGDTLDRPTVADVAAAAHAQGAITRGGWPTRPAPLAPPPPPFMSRPDYAQKGGRPPPAFDSDDQPI